MYRIVAITAGSAMLAGITMGAASAAACHKRIAGSCPGEPMAVSANASVEAAPAKPRAHARTGKQRSVRRAGRSARHLSSAERRRTAAIVARAMEREQRGGREQNRAERQQRVESPAVPPAAAAPPPIALTPTFVQTVEVRRSRPEATAPVVPDAQAAATTVPAQRATTAPQQPAAATESVDQAPAPPPAIAQSGDGAAASAPPQNEPIRASVSVPTADDSPPWLRFVFLAFGGLLAVGSAIRLFV